MRGYRCTRSRWVPTAPTTRWGWRRGTGRDSSWLRQVRYAETRSGIRSPMGPRGVYDVVEGVNTCIARVFNTFGARMRPQEGRAVPNFLAAGAKREAGDGVR
jgi:hypothetical protein